MGSKVPIITLVTLGLFGAGCNSLTSVDAPDILQPTQIDTPEGASALRVGALSNFSTWVVLSYSGVPVIDGLATDELLSGGLDPLLEDLDARRLTAALGETYFSMHQTRHNLEGAIAGYRKFPQLPRAELGELYAVLALDENYFGEMWCAGVPLTEIVNGLPQYGTPLTTQQMFQRALDDADSALVYAPDATRPFLDLTRVVRGRILLNLGSFDGAAAAVQGVPTGFLFNAEASTAVYPQVNTIGFYEQYGYYGVADQQGENGLDFVSSQDPRVAVVDNGLALDGQGEIFVLPRDTSLNAPLPIVSGVEARLIEAEAALKRSDVTTWLNTLNTLRTDGTQGPGDTLYNAGSGGVRGLAPLTDPGTDAARVDLTFRERAFWLFLTGHRLGDLRRLIRQYGRTQDQVFPVGPYKSRGSFGTDVNVMITSSENANPNFHGCLDRNP